MQVKAMKVEFVIPVVHLLDALIGPISDLPYAVSSLIEGFISLKRIEATIITPGKNGLVSCDSHPQGRINDHETQEHLPLLVKQGEHDIHTVDIANLARHMLQ